MNFHDLRNLLDLLNNYFLTFLAVFATQLLVLCTEKT